MKLEIGQGRSQVDMNRKCSGGAEKFHNEWRASTPLRRLVSSYLAFLVLKNRKFDREIEMQLRKRRLKSARKPFAMSLEIQGRKIGAYNE
jgi:hypothetical protein